MDAEEAERYRVELADRYVPSALESRRNRAFLDVTPEQLRDYEKELAEERAAVVLTPEDEAKYATHTKEQTALVLRIWREDPRRAFLIRKMRGVQ